MTQKSKYCHSPTQPQLELELDLIMGRKPPPTPPRSVDVSANGAVYREFYFFTVNSANFENSQRQNLLSYTFRTVGKLIQRFVDLRALLYFKLFFYLHTIIISECHISLCSLFKVKLKTSRCLVSFVFNS